MRIRGQTDVQKIGNFTKEAVLRKPEDGQKYFLAFPVTRIGNS